MPNMGEHVICVIPLL